MNDWRKSKLHFTAQEKRALFVIALLFILGIIIPRYMAYNVVGEQYSLTQEEDSLVNNYHQYKKKNAQFQYTYKHYDDGEKKKKNILPSSPFNPDTLTLNSWMKLGLSEKQATTLLNFKTYLGGIHSVEDLRKIFVLDSVQIASWEPFLVFSKKPFLVVELNSAQQEDLIKIKGVGPFISKQIIQYRTQLGGFISINQLKEVYGVKPETFEEVKDHLSIDEHLIRKININTIEASELSKQPYLNYNQANSIVEIRKQHGIYTKPKDLLQSKLLSQEDLVKLTPYLNFDEK
ncbi:MAG: helix-hairpin-helix domain-containing protein [Crocinitomicaceae bacterium]